MSDLIKRLRERAPNAETGFDHEMMDEAADQLEANAALIALLRASLRKVEGEVDQLTGPQHWNPIYNTDPVQRACGELPEGMEIEILLENGAGCVYLVDNNCGERISFDNADRFDWTIHDAIDAALAKQKGV